MSFHLVCLLTYQVRVPTGDLYSVGVYVPCIYSPTRSELCTLYLLTYQVRVTTGDLYSDGVYVPCIYSPTRSELPHTRSNVQLHSLYCLMWQVNKRAQVTCTLVEFMYLVFTHLPGQSYHRQLGLWWSLCTLYLLTYQVRLTTGDLYSGGVYVPCIYLPTRSDLLQVTCTLVEFMYLVFTHLPGQSYHRQLGLWWSLCTLYLLTYQVRLTTGDLYSGGVYVPCIYLPTRSDLLQVTCTLVEFMYLVFTCLPGQTYYR